MLELLSKEASELKPRSHATPTSSKPGKESEHTLEQFAKENFRKAQQVGAGGTTRQKTLIHSAGEICKHIKEWRGGDVVDDDDDDWQWWWWWLFIYRPIKKGDDDAAGVDYWPAGQGRQGEVLWSHGREPLRQPLLRLTVSDLTFFVICYFFLFVMVWSHCSWSLRVYHRTVAITTHVTKSLPSHLFHLIIKSHCFQKNPHHSIESYHSNYYRSHTSW